MGHKIRKIILLDYIALNIERQSCLPTDTISALGLEFLPHSSNSSDFASSDYDLFSSMSHSLFTKHFNNYKDVQRGLHELIQLKRFTVFLGEHPLIVRAMAHKLFLPFSQIKHVL
ncbi:hypothetical protein CEXT_172691 [Caerostris extrusa]|uniref:Maturase K n=1 Tax=Caerostris extrusa TaxID=172846 RepID=A0AAV4XIY4_CAEEX|nr:hypothetical protein CEXT_172691 [Caerostris extrusa]